MWNVERNKKKQNVWIFFLFISHFYKNVKTRIDSRCFGIMGGRI